MSDREHMAGHGRTRHMGARGPNSMPQYPSGPPRNLAGRIGRGQSGAPGTRDLPPLAARPSDITPPPMEYSAGQQMQWWRERAIEWREAAAVNAQRLHDQAQAYIAAQEVLSIAARMIAQYERPYAPRADILAVLRRVAPGSTLSVRMTIEDVIRLMELTEARHLDPPR